MWLNATKENLHSDALEFIHIARLVHIWAKRWFPSLFLWQNAEFVNVSPKNFLTGIEASGLTVTLLHVEKEVRGERI